MRLPPNDGALQKAVQHLLRPVLLRKTNPSTLADRPGERQVYYIVRPEYVWTYMSNDVIGTV